MRIIRLTYQAPDRTPKIPDCWMCLHCECTVGMTVPLLDYFGPEWAESQPWGVECMECMTIDSKAFEPQLTLIYEIDNGRN